MKQDSLSLRLIDKIFLFITLLFLEVIIFILDQNLGSGISVRPLFVVPIILSGIFINTPSTLAFIIISTMLHVESYRLSDFDSNTKFEYAPNIISNLISYFIISLVVIKGTAYRERLHNLKKWSIDQKLDEISNKPD